jgi:hypothetical protein
MTSSLDVHACPRPSADIVARVIDGQIIIIPLAAGIGDMEDELYTLNETGKEIWDRLDGARTIEQVAGGTQAVTSSIIVVSQVTSSTAETATNVLDAANDLTLIPRLSGAVDDFLTTIRADRLSAPAPAGRRITIVPLPLSDFN